jgi:hypothetical protein
VNSVNVSINKREEVGKISINGRSPENYQRVTESSKNITQQSSPNATKLPSTPSYGEKKV